MTSLDSDTRSLSRHRSWGRVHLRRTYNESGRVLGELRFHFHAASVHRIHGDIWASGTSAGLMAKKTVWCWGQNDKGKRLHQLLNAIRRVDCSPRTQHKDTKECAAHNAFQPRKIGKVHPRIDNSTQRKRRTSPSKSDWSCRNSADPRLQSFTAPKRTQRPKGISRRTGLNVFATVSPMGCMQDTRRNPLLLSSRNTMRYWSGYCQERFMTPRPLKIIGVGRYLPKRVVTNAELEKTFGLNEGWIARRNGVLERRRADLSQGETPSYMAEQASEKPFSTRSLLPRR